MTEGCAGSRQGGASDSRAAAGPVASVVICTFNRYAYCRDALESLLRQSAPAESFEVILVDNNSTDRTPELAGEFAGRFSRFVYAREAKQGLSHARNRGTAEARGEYVFYLDDDARAAEGWVATGLRIIRELRPEGFGGPYYAYYTTEKPSWYRDAYGSRELAAEARPLEPGEFLCGGNMAFRRSVLEELGGFDSRYGMTGEAVAYGEEDDFQTRLRRLMPRATLYYDPAFCILHAVKPHLMTPRGMVRSFLGHGKALNRIHGPRGPQGKVAGSRAAFAAFNLAVLVYDAAALGGLFAWRLVFRDRGRLPSIWNWLEEHGKSRVQKIGGKIERLRIAMDAEAYRVWSRGGGAGD